MIFDHSHQDLGQSYDNLMPENAKLKKDPATFRDAINDYFEAKCTCPLSKRSRSMHCMLYGLRNLYGRTIPFPIRQPFHDRPLLTCYKGQLLVFGNFACFLVNFGHFCLIFHFFTSVVRASRLPWTAENRHFTLPERY